ncbi:fluoride efflux transporter CrcB [Actinomycetospora endophytica]|uniref:Fluoride-specific ion channel FluC n=1 Tax=Actinomycetospora endophytica TaxID=2291215 RepID=A0ABS8PHC1_9PSEU|nr:fluoride efflux transporter CrcB [Actinomycetospora endophytica]MCD2197332.1 fluoride efflux transporter CrcB [Actinomycetospora endophytica]
MSDDHPPAGRSRAEDPPDPPPAVETTAEQTAAVGAAHPDGRAEQPEIAEDVIAGREPGADILRGQGAIVAAVALGGVIGSLARWAVGVAWPTAHGAFPSATLTINIVGCLLMGVLVVHVAEARTAHPIVRPLLGVGVLGGFTTFSTFSVDTEQLLSGGHLGTALGYLLATTAGSVGAAALGLALARRTSRRVPRRSAP